MHQNLTCVLLLLPTLIFGQSAITIRYVDDRINENTYLRLKGDSSFIFRYSYDTMGDEATGRYKRHGDTIFLTFTKDTIVSGAQYYYHNTAARADSLIIKGHLLYQISNGQSREFEPQEISHHKMPKNMHFKRKFILFGPWHSSWSRYYMVEEKYAKWKKWRRRAGIK